MSATDTETQAPVGAPESVPAATDAAVAPVVIPESPRVPLDVTVTLDDGIPEVSSPEWGTTEVPRDGDTLPDGDTFANFGSDGSLVTTASLAQAAYEREKSKVDLPRFDRAYRAFQQRFVQLAVLQRAGTRLEDILTEMVMETRLSVVLQNGDPDYWGKSYAYRILFKDRILGFMVKQGFGLDEATKILNNVTQNYVRRREAVLNAAAFAEAKAGHVKAANVTKTEVTTVKDEQGNEREAIVITFDKQDKDGNPKTEVWKPGDASVPKPIAAAIRAAAKRADGGKEGTTFNRLPDKVKPKTTPNAPRANESGGNERNYAEESRDAIEAWMACIGHVAPLELVAQLHEAATALSDFLIGKPGRKPNRENGIPGGPKAVGEAMSPIAHLFEATGRNLAADGRKEDVAKYRYLTDEESLGTDANEQDNEQDTDNNN